MRKSNEPGVQDENQIGSISVAQTGPNTARVTVTSGTFIGKQVQFITVPPSAAYFNEVAPTPDDTRKRA